MNGAVLQVLLILAYLAIGLVSVTFPIYAIAVNFLPQQKWESEKERKKRMDELKAKISELTAQLGGQAPDTETKMREQLDKYEAEKEGTELRYRYLTAKGAVLAPVTTLIPALLFAVTGTYAFYKDSVEWAIGLGVFSALSSAVALYRLYKTISAVEYGALRPERTVEFVVGFGNDFHKTEKTKLSESQSITLMVKTPEYDTENLVLSTTFPIELGVIGKFTDLSIISSQYKDYSTIRLSEHYLPKGMGIGFSFHAIPNKIGKYLVDVRVCAKGIYEYQENLTIEVV